MSYKDKTRQELIAELDELKNRLASLEKVDATFQQYRKDIDECEERYHNLVHASLIPILVHAEEKIIFLNFEAVSALGGTSEDEFIGKSVWDFVPPEYVDRSRERIKKVYTKEQDAELVEIQILRLDGQSIDVKIMGTIIDYKGKPAAQVIFWDISRHKKAEQEVNRRIQMEKIINHISIKMLVSEDHELDNTLDDILRMIGEFAHVDRSYIFIFPEDLSTMTNTHEWCAPGIEPQIANLQQLPTDAFPWWMKKMKNNENVYIPDISQMPKEAEAEKQEFELQDIKSMIVVPILIKEKLVGFMGFDSVRRFKEWTDADIGLLKTASNILASTWERNAANESLKIQKTYLEALFESSPDAVVILDENDRILRINREFVRLFGYTEDEAVGRKINDLIVPAALNEEASVLSTRVANHESVDAESVRQSKDGRRIAVSIRGKPFLYGDNQLAVYGIYRDITKRKQAEKEKRQLENQLRQAQKMEAIGSLAGGIAHDFNNILSVIMGYTEMTFDYLPPDSRGSANLREVISAADRAREMIKQILAFSRKDERKRMPVYLGQIVEDALKLLRFSLPSYIEIRSDIKESLSPVLADATQIHQVIMNICTNAAHSMRDTGGVLDIELKEDYFERGTIIPGELKPGRYQQLTFHDTGYGMREEIRERIFEPYFTTKRPGDGTGMGLAMVHGIIKSHRGDITVQSEPGKGTSFHVFLPVTDQTPMDERKETEPVQGGTERILFVDDEPSLLALGKLMLENLGYQVLTRGSSLEALEAFRSSPHLFDLVLTDQAMPGMTGDRLAAEMKRIRPDIPIILCTGFSEKINEENFKSMGIDAYIMKPFVKKELGTIVRDLLEQR